MHPSLEPSLLSSRLLPTSLGQQQVTFNSYILWLLRLGGGTRSFLLPTLGLDFLLPNHGVLVVMQDSVLDLSMSGSDARPEHNCR